mmetsp:Transcript_30398/g.55117  ORF Transcript_30398/g.55117 Transcript_30398/m.55117 type:complete len:172 (+) Transcript_30398:3-518(+)
MKKRARTPLSDGWGLDSYGQSLVMTDSGHELIFLDPETFELQRKVTVQDDGKIVEMVNELETIGDEIWGNIFGNDCLARIEPASGTVTGWVLLDGILDRARADAAAEAAGIEKPDVLNGIAWDADNKRLFVTGKLWPELYEIEIVELPTDDTRLAKARAMCIPTVNIFRMR